MNRIRQILVKRATGKQVFIAFAIAIPLQLLLMTVLLSRVEYFAGSHEPLDMRWGFSPSEAHVYLARLGGAGRSVYLWLFHGVDYAFSLASGVAWALLLTLLFHRNGLSHSRWYGLHVAPLFITAFDYLENIAIDALILMYPAFQPWVARLAAAANQIKNAIVVVSFAAIIVLTLRLAIRALAAWWRFPRRKR